MDIGVHRREFTCLACFGGSLEVSVCVAVGSVSPPSDCVKMQVILCMSVVTVFTPLMCELRVGFSGQLRAVSGM